MFRNKLDWSDNITELYKRDQSHLYLLRRLRSFGVQGLLLKSFYNSVVASAIFYAVGCWCGAAEGEKKRLNKLICRIGSEGVPWTHWRCCERKMKKAHAIMGNTSHTCLSFSSRPSNYSKECLRRSFVPVVPGVFNVADSQSGNFMSLLSAMHSRLCAIMYVCMYVFI